MVTTLEQNDPFPRCQLSHKPRQRCSERLWHKLQANWNNIISTHHLRDISRNLKVYTLCADFHTKGFPLLTMTLILSGTPRRIFAAIILEIDLLLTLAMTLVSSDQHLRGLERLISSVPWMYFFLFCLIISGTVLRNFCSGPWVLDHHFELHAPESYVFQIYDFRIFGAETSY